MHGNVFLSEDVAEKLQESWETMRGGENAIVALSFFNNGHTFAIALVYLPSSPFCDSYFLTCLSIPSRQTAFKS